MEFGIVDASSALTNSSTVTTVLTLVTTLFTRSLESQLRGKKCETALTGMIPPMDETRSLNALSELPVIEHCVGS